MNPILTALVAVSLASPASASDVNAFKTKLLELYAPWSEALGTILKQDMKPMIDELEKAKASEDLKRCADPKSDEKVRMEACPKVLKAIGESVANAQVAEQFRVASTGLEEKHAAIEQFVEAIKPEARKKATEDILGTVAMQFAGSHKRAQIVTLVSMKELEQTCGGLEQGPKLACAIDQSLDFYKNRLTPLIRENEKEFAKVAAEAKKRIQGYKEK